MKHSSFYLCLSNGTIWISAYSMQLEASRVPLLNSPAIALTSALTLHQINNVSWDSSTCPVLLLLSSPTLPAWCEPGFLNLPRAAAVELTNSARGGDSFIDITPPLCIEHSVSCCQGNSQRAAITTCTSTLKCHLILEDFPSTSPGKAAVGRVNIAIAMCMCAQQIFFDGSAKKRTFATAFKHAVAVYSNKASASGLLASIECWVDRYNSPSFDSGDNPDIFQNF
ncbi:hypothetical protein K438DRAFT_1766555 [Mycena galopus ATCC 62051]|nr:hypothetical protein K438DRAFT_1766555 [Mycena galopus ATCC 62051]